MQQTPKLEAQEPKACPPIHMQKNVQIFLGNCNICKCSREIILTFRGAFAGGVAGPVLCWHRGTCVVRELYPIVAPTFIQFCKVKITVYFIFIIKYFCQISGDIHNKKSFASHKNVGDKQQNLICLCHRHFFVVTSNNYMHFKRLFLMGVFDTELWHCREYGDNMQRAITCREQSNNLLLNGINTEQTNINLLMYLAFCHMCRLR